MRYWVVASKHSRDESTQEWDSKWTVNSFIKNKKYYPTVHKEDFEKGDFCLLRIFGYNQLIAGFKINSDPLKDSDKDAYYEIDNVEEWDFPVEIQSLPNKYKEILTQRAPAMEIDEPKYHELIGIKHFFQNLKIQWKNIIQIQFSEKDIETLLDSMKNPLKSQLNLEIVGRQIEITKGRIIDLICKDKNGDIVVIELKKHSATKTVGQLATYISDVKENYAKRTQKVKGLILASSIDEPLIKASRGINFDLVLYQLVFD